MSFLAPRTLDIVNGTFKLVGAVGAWMNAYWLFKDNQIKGVYWPLYIFFCVWGLWNLLYYPSLHQWFSFSAGAILVLGNLVWLFQALRLWDENRAIKRIENFLQFGPKP